MQYPAETKWTFTDYYSINLFEQLDVIPIRYHDKYGQNHTVVPEDRLRFLLDKNKVILEFVRSLISDFRSEFNPNVHLTLINSDGCMLFSCEDKHIGKIYNVFDVVKENDEINKSLNKGTNFIIDVYCEESDTNIVCMPMMFNDSVLYLGMTNEHGRITPTHRRLGSHIYKLLHIMLTQFKSLKDSLLDLNPDCAILIDERGYITDLNKNCLALFGLNCKEMLIGIHIKDIFDNVPTLMQCNAPATKKSLKAFVQNNWLDIELLHREEIFITITSKEIAIVFKPASRKNSLSLLPVKLENGPNVAFGNFIVNNPKMLSIIAAAKKVSKFLTTVLIEGESGTGKEMIAKGIHEASGRKGPFVVINCGGIPRELLQSELFGYTDGAFTGARKGGYIGKFLQANQGTIFLDEIGEMPLDMQVSLLRFLQDRIIIPIGDNKMLKANVRVIAATNRNLRNEVAKGRFREDLYYRLNVINFKMPPLRERKEDIPILAEHLINKICMDNKIPIKTINKRCMKQMEHYPWPGNVRELQNLLERAVILSADNEITIDDLFIDEIHLKAAVDEKTTIIEMLDQYEQNISSTAEALGIARTTLYRKIKKLNINLK